MKTFEVCHSFAQIEYRIFHIEAETEEQAKKQLRDIYESGQIFEYKTSLGDTIDNHIEISEGDNIIFSDDAETLMNEEVEP